MIRSLIRAPAAFVVASISSMQLSRTLILALALFTTAACATANGSEDKEAPAIGSATSKEKATDKPTTHVFRVTLRDVNGVEAYTQDDDGCTSSAVKGWPHQLVVTGPDDESQILKSVDIPRAAQLTMGACEAKMTITVPYASRYSFGIAMEGRGIASPDALEPDWITAEGDSQNVTVVTHVVTTVKVTEATSP